MGGGGDRVPIVLNLTISITYPYSAGKAMNKTNFQNEISKENYKTNIL